MCGRYTLKTPLHQVATAFAVAPDQVSSAEPDRPRYNVAPTQPVAAVRTVQHTVPGVATNAAPGSARELAWLQWGLIPSWASDPAIGSRMINARSETLAEKPAYREAFRSRRCLIAADGFYEWRQHGKSKQPYYIQVDGGALFALAGLWESWQHGEQTIESCTIVTTSANQLLRPLHERMPVILPAEHHAVWLDANQYDPQRLASLLVPFPAERMTLYAVGTLVNSPRNDAPAYLDRQTERTQRTLFD